MSLTESSDDDMDGAQIEIKTKEPDIKLADRIAVKDVALA